MRMKSGNDLKLTLLYGTVGLALEIKSFQLKFSICAVLMRGISLAAGSVFTRSCESPIEPLTEQTGN